MNPDFKELLLAFNAHNVEYLILIWVSYALVRTPKIALFWAILSAVLVIYLRPSDLFRTL